MKNSEDPEFINEHPFVSIIMPVQNEEKFIEASLGALLHQTYPIEKMEIIIADGQSVDSTHEKINDLKKTTAIPIKIIENPKKIAPSGLNTAIIAAKGEVIIRVDGHTIVDENYVRECVNALLSSDACNVGGKMNAVSQKVVGQAISLATSSRFGIGNARFHFSNKEEYVDTVYLGAWKKQVFEQVGLFNEELVRNQDDEFNYRLRSKGYKILLSPKIKSYYFNRSSFKLLWRQYFQYGYWKVRVLQLHPRQMRWRQFVPFLFVIMLFLTAFISLFSVFGRLGFLFIISSYSLCNLFASVIASKSKISLLPLVSLSFAILHFSYGLGFMVGLISFRDNWRKSHIENFSLSKLL